MKVIFFSQIYLIVIRETDFDNNQISRITFSVLEKNVAIFDFILTIYFNLKEEGKDIENNSNNNKQQYLKSSFN